MKRPSKNPYPFQQNEWYKRWRSNGEKWRYGYEQ